MRHIIAELLMLLSSLLCDFTQMCDSVLKLVNDRVFALVDVSLHHLPPNRSHHHHHHGIMPLTYNCSAALWALLLPAHMDPRVSDIWRGYLAQRLVWEVGGVAAFFPPRATQVKGFGWGHARGHIMTKLEWNIILLSLSLSNSLFLSPSQSVSTESDVVDLQAESPLYSNTTPLIATLLGWEHQPVGNTTLPDVMLSLIAVLLQRGFWSRQDAELTVAWLEDLISVGYRFPTLKKTVGVEGVGVEESSIKSLPAPFLTVPQQTPIMVRGRREK